MKTLSPFSSALSHGQQIKTTAAHPSQKGPPSFVLPPKVEADFHHPITQKPLLRIPLRSGFLRWFWDIYPISSMEPH
jgi:hypothetical protein